jgi:hypothetical protein
MMAHDWAGVDGPLMLAVKAGDLVKVQQLFLDGDRNYVEVAAQLGHPAIVVWLLENGMKIEDPFGWAFLSTASGGHLRTVQYLFAKSPFEGYILQRTIGYATINAAVGGHLETLKWLMKEAGGREAAAHREPSGLSVLLVAVEQEQLEVVKWLLSEGGSLITERQGSAVTENGGKYDEDSDGSTSLLLAAENGSTSLHWQLRMARASW